jgi:hypothetical protein
VNALPPTLERVTRTALLGVRFWDRVTGHATADGLEVVDLVRDVCLQPNRSGVFVLHEYPGLRASAFGAGDDPFWASPPARAELTLAVSDGSGRFLPFRFDADAPTRGLFIEDCGIPFSPPDGPIVGVPLFSAPARIAPAGTAAVRADLRDVVTGAPAASAILEVSAAGMPIYRGVADERGSVVVLFPYPEPPWHGTSPPPGSRALSDQTWSVSVSVRYSAAATSPPAGDPPDLCGVLTQSPATLLTTPSPPLPLGAQTLAFGRELVLRTAGRSDLLVVP